MCVHTECECVYLLEQVFPRLSVFVLVFFAQCVCMRACMRVCVCVCVCVCVPVVHHVDIKRLVQLCYVVTCHLLQSRVSPSKKYLSGSFVKL